eukprot:TRINITY_DN6753_c0_g1_i2.p1 TRINITY_DN6753_c0_g1~~TRINITY_DN6753_c0_g1_i2.p1  ORF type:complete len:293 (-),score=37.09 TRINITY_DN6753_c0_g1_i2:26-904(-)
MGENWLDCSTVNMLLGNIMRHSISIIDHLEGDDIDMREDTESMKTLKNLTEMLGTIAKTHSSYYFSCFMIHIPFLLSLLNDNRLVCSKIFAICIFDDLVMYRQNNFLNNMYPLFIPRMIEYSKSSSYELRQASLFGLGIIYKNAGNNCEIFAEQVFNTIFEYIGDNKYDTSEDAGIVVENATSSLAQILLYASNTLDNSQIEKGIERVIFSLPLHLDKVEAIKVHTELLPNLFELYQNKICEKQDQLLYLSSVIEKELEIAKRMEYQLFKDAVGPLTEFAKLIEGKMYSTKE